MMYSLTCFCLCISCNPGLAGFGVAYCMHVNDNILFLDCKCMVLRVAVLKLVSVMFCCLEDCITVRYI